MVFFMDGWMDGKLPTDCRTGEESVRVASGCQEKRGGGGIVRGELDGSGRNKRDMEYIITQ